MRSDERFIQDAGRQLFSGAEALVKGALETPGGVHLFTGVPAPPLGEFFDALETIGPLLTGYGQVARIAGSESSSIAMAAGAQLAGCRAMVALSGAGLSAASAALAQAVLTGTRDDSGALIVCGDDPWNETTPLAHDSRFCAEHIRLPLLEPATPQEAKDWVARAFRLGAAGRMFIGFMMTTALAEGGGTVICRRNHFPQVNEQQKRTLSVDRDVTPRIDQTAPVPRGDALLRDLPARLAAVLDEARRQEINAVHHRPQRGDVAPIGFIASGEGYAHLLQALSEMRLTGRLPILRLGLTYPLDETMIVDFARCCRRVLVIEQRRRFVERQVLDILSRADKDDGDVAELYDWRHAPVAGEDAVDRLRLGALHPSVLMQRLIPLLEDHPAALPAGYSRTPTGSFLQIELDRIRRTGEVDVEVPQRTPTFCAGCPHRDTSSVLLDLRRDLFDPQYMLEHHKRKPVELICHGDAGCSSLLTYPPNRSLVHAFTGKGLGGAAGGGAGPFIENKQLVFMGNGTFFQNGQTIIGQSIHRGQDVTYVILDNKTTAFTGSHRRAGHRGAIDLMGRPAVAQDIARIIEGMIPKKMRRDLRVVSINPADRWRYRNLLESSVLADGVKVIIADKECGVTYHRREQQEQREVEADLGFLPRQKFMNVATDVCEDCRECTRRTGCPALTLVDTDYGTKVQTDLSSCVDDGACQRIGACPSFEQVTIVRRHPVRKRWSSAQLFTLPSPARPVHGDQETYRCFIAGVGGMGVDKLTEVLGCAGRAMGYHVQFLRHKGVAIRTGSVFSQIVFTRHGTEDARGGSAETVATAAIPYGKADCLLGVDLLEAARGLDPAEAFRIASPDRTCAVVNTVAAPTVSALTGDTPAAEPKQLSEALRRATRSDRYWAGDLAELCRQTLGSSRHVNLLLLGIAFQRGYVPLRLDTIEEAIRSVMSQSPGVNLRAFALGRQIAAYPQEFPQVFTSESQTLRATYREKVEALRHRWPGPRGRETSRRFRALIQRTSREAGGLAADTDLARDVVVRAFDCLIWGGMPYAERYCNHLITVARRDDAEHGYRITRAVVWNLAKVMLIKDEIYVSSLLTSPEKYRRDRLRFNVDLSRGDEIAYRHYHRPEFVIFGRRIRFEWTSRDWQLRLMSRMGLLRKLMPGWHRRERAFRDWYERLVERFDYTPDQSEQHYHRWLSILDTPSSVNGFREVRYPKMAAARRRGEQLLAMPAEMFEPPHADSDVPLAIVQG